MKKIVLILAVMASFCSAVLSENHTVYAGMFYYSPSELTISFGDTVTWINDGGTHDVNANVNSITEESFNNPVSFGSGYISGVGDVIYTHVFTTEGTYNYDCSYSNHAQQGMVGQIIVESPTIMDIVQNSENHTTLTTAILAAGLDETLNSEGPFTLFAPSDDAFAAVDPMTLQLLLANIPLLTEKLLDHVVNGTVMSSDLNYGDVLTNLNDSYLTVSIDGMTYMIDMSTITTADIEASNGVVHVIDMVLMPDTEGPLSIMGIVGTSDAHTLLYTAITAADLNETLTTGGPFTLFAPSDDSFDAIPPADLENLLADIPTLTNILLNHVVDSTYMAADLSNGDVLTSLYGSELTVTIDNMTYMIDLATITLADIVASNGVVHVIDMVLVPSTNDLTVMNIIENSLIHTTLETAINAAGLAETLSGQGTFTVFAPTDDIFNALPAGNLELLLANPALLENILLGHVHGSVLFSTDLTDGLNLTMLNNDEYSITNDGMNIMIGIANVTSADHEATNGVVHFIDNILMTNIVNPDTITVMDIIEASPAHNTLEAAIVAADLDGTLSGDGPFTVFAPTDAAFDALPAGTVAGLLADIPALSEVLLHHVHSGTILSSALVDGMSIATLNDDNLVVTIDGATVMVDMATVTTADIEATNGVVHVINMVLVPADPSAIEEYYMTDFYMYTLNLLGEKVDRDTKGEVLIDIYSNGKTIKRLNLSK